MSDPFERLGVPRRPGVDLEMLREHYLDAAKLNHPDAAGGSEGTFSELKEAYDTLREPAKRLRFLAADAVPIDQSRGIGHADLFLSVAAAIQSADKILQSPPPASSLAKAVQAGQVQAARRQLEASLGELANFSHACETRLQELDRQWPKVSTQELLALASHFTFAKKWTLQAREKKFRLEGCQ